MIYKKSLNNRIAVILALFIAIATLITLLGYQALNKFQKSTHKIASQLTGFAEILPPNTDFSFYENLLKQKQEASVYTPKIPIIADLTGDGKPEFIYITGGIGCASCHILNIHIFKNQNEIYNETFANPIFAPIPGLGFDIIQPDSETNRLTGPFIVTSYWWDGKKFLPQTQTFSSSPSTPKSTILPSPLASSTPAPTSNTVIQDRIKQVDAQIQKLQNQRQTWLDVMNSAANCVAPTCQSIFYSDEATVNSLNNQIQQLQNEKDDLQLQLNK